LRVIQTLNISPFFLISVTIDSRDVPMLKVQTLDSMEALKKVMDDYDSILFHTKMDDDDIY
jgi:hypothetical protein